MKKNKYMHAKSLQLCPTLRPYGLLPTKLFCPWDSPGKNTGVGCYAAFQEIFLIQGSNPGFGRWVLYASVPGKLCICIKLNQKLTRHGKLTSCCSVTKLCPTFCDIMDCTTPGSSVLLYVPEFAQIHVH